jgi:SAM-dependent methyltransferase
LLKRNREQFIDRHAGVEDWRIRSFSATSYALWQASQRLLAKHCRGRVLDAGAGRGVFMKSILDTASAYESIDLAPRGGRLTTWVGDITDMPEVPGARYDTVVCQQVLEHVPRPWMALAEFHRVLKPGGKVVVSVPHLSRRHELPDDYFRYTQEGLTSLLKDSGFEVLELRPYGGVLSFLHHQTSFLFPGLLTGIPVLGTAALLLNAPLSWLLAAMDPMIDRASLLPLGVMAVARKPAAESRRKPEGRATGQRTIHG